MCLLKLDEVVTALAPFIGSPTWNGKHFTMISVGQICSDQTAAFFCRLDYDGRFTDSSNNTVAFEEILAVGLASAPKLGHKTAVLFYFVSVFCVYLRIDLIKPVCHTGNGLQPVVHRGLLNGNIYPVGQSTNYNRVMGPILL